jgi:acetoin utilization deacetylase AcuC-like enzyme
MTLILDDKIGDPEYLAAFHHIIMPIAQEFDPDLVFSLLALLI